LGAPLLEPQPEEPLAFLPEEPLAFLPEEPLAFLPEEPLAFSLEEPLDFLLEEPLASPMGTLSIIAAGVDALDWVLSQSSCLR
jgi:hypothetical protein